MAVKSDRRPNTLNTGHFSKKESLNKTPHFVCFSKRLDTIATCIYIPKEKMNIVILDSVKVISFIKINRYIYI